MQTEATTRSTGLLGDTPARDYALKLQMFNAFAASELRGTVASLNLRPGMRVLDAGCGTADALPWLLDSIGPSGMVAGIDLSLSHLRAAPQTISQRGVLVQGNIEAAPFAPGSFDLIWSANALNHLTSPVAALKELMLLVRPMGRIALLQSCFLPDMVFSWDARLERLVNEAVREYYRVRYGLDERDLAGVRSLVGQLRTAGLREVQARTIVVERIAPLSAEDEHYLLEAIFRRTWGERLRPFLAPDDYHTLARLCDPHGVEFALRRADFHFIQTLTIVTAVR